MKKRDCMALIGHVANLSWTQGALDANLMWSNRAEGRKSKRGGNTAITTTKLIKRAQSMCAIPPHLSKVFAK